MPSRIAGIANGSGLPDYLSSACRLSGKSYIGPKKGAEVDRQNRQMRLSPQGRRRNQLMNSKKTKIQIDVKIGEEHISMAVPFAQQDNVRHIEAELNLFLKEIRERQPNRWPSTYLAMAAYEFASKYIILKERYEKESDEAEDLLMEMSRLLGAEDSPEEAAPTDEFDIY